MGLSAVAWILDLLIAEKPAASVVRERERERKRKRDWGQRASVRDRKRQRHILRRRLWLFGVVAVGVGGEWWWSAGVVAAS